MKLTVTVFFERRERKKQRLQSFFSLRPNAHFFPLPLPPAGLIIQQSSFPPISYYSLPLFLLPVLRVKEDVFEAPLAWPPTALGSSSLEGIRRDSLSIIQTGRARGPLGLRPLGGEALPYIPIPSTGVEHWLHRCVLGLQNICLCSLCWRIYCTCRPGIFIASLLYMKAIRRIDSVID